MKSFKVDWVIKNKIAIGIAPRKRDHLNTLKNQGIKSIISFKDIHFDSTLNERIANITGMPINETVKQYIVDYRNANRIYWK